MKRQNSKKGNVSKQPRKQRKIVYQMDLHQKGKLLNVHLSTDLRKKYEIRSLRVRKGDKVKIISGQHKNKSGRIEKVDLDKIKVTISGIETIKKDGSKSFYKFHPSNLMITELDLSDKLRLKRTNKTNLKSEKSQSKVTKTDLTKKEKVETKVEDTIEKKETKKEIKKEKVETKSESNKKETNEAKK